MTLVHPSRAGAALSLFFVDDRPVRLVSGRSRYRIVGEPKCADINGIRYWRLRARSDSGQDATFDVRESADGWVLAGVDEPA